MPAATASLASSGWIKIPVNNGAALIVQWGLASVLGKYDLNFPIAFPTGCLAFNATAHTTEAADVSAIGIVNGYAKDKASAYLVCATVSGGVLKLHNRSVYWIAIGY